MEDTATIMVVDDDKDTRLSAKSLLESKGYDVIVAVSGDDCLKLLKKNAPDLILMDILMPGKPVVEVIPKIKNIKIIMFSVVTLQENPLAKSVLDLVNGNEFPNVVDYIQKPVDSHFFLERIKMALDNR